MKKAGGITAPLLLIMAMLCLIIFQRVLFNLDTIRYTAEYGSGYYIIYNGERYIPDRFFVLVFTMRMVAFILPALVYIQLFKSEGYLKKELNFLKLPELKHTPLIFYGLGALIFGTALLKSLIYYVSGSSVLRAPVIDAGGNPVYDISVMVVFIFVPAVCEELLFRSIMLKEYERYGAACACVISSAAFAMLRFSLVLFPVYFFAGIILFGISKASGSILFAVIAHAGYSFFNIYIWTRLSVVLSFEQNRFIFSFLAAVIFVICMIALLNKTEKIYYYKTYSNVSEPESAADRLPAFKALSPTFIAAAIIYFIGVNT